jgi:hypothetical protein
MFINGHGIVARLFRGEGLIANRKKIRASDPSRSLRVRDAGWKKQNATNQFQSMEKRTGL